jgi:hypothetical protein
MKSLLVGVVLVGLAFSVNAGGTRSVGTSQHVHSLIPMCPIGEEAKLVNVNGVYKWECVPID